MSYISHPHKIFTHIPKSACEWLEWGSLSPRSSFRFSSAEGLSSTPPPFNAKGAKTWENKGQQSMEKQKGLTWLSEARNADKRSSLWEQELGCLECGNRANRNFLGTRGFMNDWSDSAPSMTRLSLPGAAFLILGILLFPSFKKENSKETIGFAHSCSCWDKMLQTSSSYYSLVHTWLG